jgi:hypothetical protein
MAISLKWINAKGLANYQSFFYGPYTSSRSTNCAGRRVGRFSHNDRGPKLCQYLPSVTG